MNPHLLHSTSPGAFEARYVASNDPWQFETSGYEQARYATTLRALSRPHYDVVYEPGCSIGVLTARLASLANRVIASDVAPSALKVARERCAAMKNVTFLCQDIADFVPNVPLDLLVLSEIGYYFDATTFARIASTLAGSLRTQGELVAVHWLGRSEDHVLHGDEVHQTLLSALSLEWLKGERHEHFRIDSWVNS